MVSRLFVTLAAVAVSLSQVLAESTPAPSSVASGSASAASPAPVVSGSAARLPLNPEALASAAKVDSVTIPSPGEMMTALNKEAKPNWQSAYRAPIPTTFSSRIQIALNVGGLIADGYMAVEAEDSQQVKNIGKDIISLAKSLAVSESVISRGNSIFDFAESNEWNSLKEELDATQNEVKLALEEHHDNDLVSLVSLGAWIRGTEVVSGWISDNYTVNAAKLLRQPAIVALMRAKIGELPGKVQSDPLMKNVSGKLEAIQQIVTFSSDKAPSKDDVKRLKELSKGLMEAISKKRETK